MSNNRRNSSKEVSISDLDININDQSIEEETFREQTISPTSPTLKPSLRKRAHSTSFSVMELLETYGTTLQLNPTTSTSFGRTGAKSGSTSKHSWEKTLEKAAKAIVSIRANQVRSFDTETSGAYNATGFIIDTTHGIILTNRHVVSPAPIVATAVFYNYEEVELRAIYRDPVHDFGFLKFDPTKVHFTTLTSIPLDPTLARVGLDVRVVGNDAGEKLSILAGTLARLDRKAPDYGVGEFNDFNTFYYQAASSTSGGSSGSPVLDISGSAIALNAGGSNKASSSYYLPLNRIERALQFVRRGEVVPRGTLQTEFEHLPYDEVRRLGLPQQLELVFRKSYPDGTGLLVVNQILAEGPADGKLNSGDIVIKVNKVLVTNFVELFDVLDNHVSQDVEFEVSRGPRLVTVTITVQDLHSITPARFVEIGGGVVHELSYQLAKSYNHAVRGVYIATSGHMFGSASAWRKSIIVSVNHAPTPTLDAFIDVVEGLSDGARVPVRFYDLAKAYKEKVMIMHVDRHWHPFRVATRNDTTGLWDFTTMPPAPTSVPYEPCTARIAPLSDNLRPGNVLMSSFVSVDFHPPYLVDGMKTSQFFGAGIIVNVERGLVICDRDTVPISIGDIFVTFANSIVIPGKLVFLHPIYNFSVVQYDPHLLGETQLRAATLLFEGEDLRQGESVYFVGVSSDHSPIVKKTKISTVTNVSTKECIPPRWRAMNVETIKLDHSIVSLGGVLCNEGGEVRALWMNYSYQDDKGQEVSIMAGLAVRYTRQVIEALNNDVVPVIRGLDVEFWSIRIAAARTLGLSEEWVTRIEGTGEKPQILYILNKLSSESPAASKFKEGDLILEANGAILSRIADLDNLLSLETIDFTILRDREVLKVQVQTTPLYGQETDRLVAWAGALIQNANRAVLEQVKIIPLGVYVSCTLFGSPVNTYNLRPGVWITEINGVQVTGLDMFQELVKHLDNGTNNGYARLVTVNRQNVTRVLSLKLDDHYWPAMEIARDANVFSGWRCRLLE